MESYQTVAGGKLASPSIQELPKLHQELGLWMAHTRYQAQPMDQMQIWRMQNTSVTFSTAAGIMSFFFFKRFNPAAKFPLDLIPPFFMFYFTHRAAQAAQLPGLYESFLVLSTPMGFKAREILQAMRENGRLPSHEFGTQLPFQQQRQQMQQQQQQQQQELKMQRQRNHHQELEHEQNEHQHQLPLPPVVSALVFASCPMSEGVSTPMKPTLPRLTGSALQVPIPMPIAEVFGTSVAGSPSTLRSASPGESDGGLSPVFLGPYVDGGGQKRLQALRARGQFLVDCGTSAIAQMATEVNDYDIVAPSSPSVSPSPPIDGDFLGQAAVNLGSSRLQRLRALGRGLDADSSSSSPLADVARGQKPRCDRFKALRCDVSRKSHIRSSSKTKSGIL
mmetsp:Transcript_4632/g.11006  ORF Transcript_4632/g.11006 Transcript_4632/m.11006 type:complete len:391 (+) Transcript_4632:130-1302(+)